MTTAVTHVREFYNISHKAMLKSAEIDIITGKVVCERDAVLRLYRNFKI